MYVLLIILGIAGAIVVLLMGDLMVDNNYDLPQNLFEDEGE